MTGSERQPGVRQVLLDLYQQALRAVDGATRVRTCLSGSDHAPVSLVAIGKAAAAMAAGARDVLGNRLLDGLLISKQGHCPYADAGGLVCLESEHPVPGAASLAAGQRLLAFLAALPPDRELLFLLSGGASSLVEVLPPGIDGTQLAAVNRWLLGSGLAIAEVNRLRKRLSAIKAGRLVRYIGPRRVTQLILSDVPGDDVAAIGSGPLVPHMAADLALPARTWPDWLDAVLARPPALPAADAFRRVRTRVIASSRVAVDAAATAARDRGLSVVAAEHSLLTGDAVEAGRQWATRLCAMPPGVLVQGAETTIVLPDRPGRGGRCQSLALAAAQVLAGRDDCFLLAVGTDGSDEPGRMRVPWWMAAPWSAVNWTGWMRRAVSAGPTRAVSSRPVATSSIPVRPAPT